MYSNSPKRRGDRNSRELSDLDERQAGFLRRIGTLIPALLRAVARGAVESRWILGRRQLKDGRNAEMSIVVKAPALGSGTASHYRSGGATEGCKEVDDGPSITEGEKEESTG